MSEPRARVLIATPCYEGNTHYRYTESVAAAWVYCLFHKIEVTLKIAPRFTLVQYARNYCAALFLRDPKLTHIMWVDSDLGFDPRAIVKLVERDKDIVGGVYPVKSVPTWFPYEPLDEPDATGLQRAKSLPGGFLLVKRHVMEALAATVPQMKLEHQGETIRCANIYELVHRGEDLLGEDVIFCERAREQGFELWADTDINFSHCGMFEWAGNLAGRIAHDKAANQEIPDNVTAITKAVRETMNGAQEAH